MGTIACFGNCLINHGNLSSCSYNMTVTGVWIGKFWYDLVPEFTVAFVVTLSQFEAVISGCTTEKNIFDSEAGQILIGELAGSVNGQRVHFIKAYTNGAANNSRIKYEGNLSDDRNYISGEWVISGIGIGGFKMVRAVEQPL